MQRLLTTSLVILLLSLASCQNSQKQGEQKEEKKEQKEEASKKKVKETGNYDRKYNDIARFIAGMTALEGSAIAEYHNNQEWKNYAKSSDTLWKDILDKKRPVMTQWRDAEIKELAATQGTLFYPFSGPDFLHVSIFFPKIDTVYMFGLEPIGNTPDIKKIVEKSLPNYLLSLQASLGSILKNSFFITREMAYDFTGARTNDIDGTLPALMMFLVRTNHEILFYEQVAINSEGKLEKAEGEKKKGVYYGTKIEFKPADEEVRKVIYYFGVNLCDDPYMTMDGMKTKTEFVTFLKNIPFKTTYLKSASYLMHGNNYSTIREIILSKSKHVFQDDSGMAFRNFNNDQWDYVLFGKYIGPIDIFRGYYQNDYAKAYEDKNKVRPLTFGIGYQYKDGSSTLMLAKKK
ncbi:MAG: hypothetical protein EAZ55_14155 [Cytophagales bacterium]|nr:MAG: hypothetical protein EAZ55_14155 [Cytophagales bacterium]